MTYVRNAWYVAGFEMDLEPGKPFATSLLDEPIVLFRTSDGRVVALEDRCVHRLAPLSLGRCEGDRLRCMYHGLLFDADGKCVEIPGQEMIPAKARVRTYPVVAKHSWIWVWMGDPARADPALVPPAIGYDDPAWVVGHGHLDYAADARLIADNLLDFSHVTFVHADSFQMSPEYAYLPPRVAQLDRGVRIERWTENTMGSTMVPAGELVDHYVTYDFLVPGIDLLWSGYFPQGTARACSYGRPDLSKGFGLAHQSHAGMPVSDRAARYYFLSAAGRAEGAEEACRMGIEVLRLVLEEDKRIIEGQQRIMDLTPELRVMPTAHDLAIGYYDRAIARLLKEEQGSAEAAA